MEFQPLSIDGAWIARSALHKDERGSFREWFRNDDMRTTTGFNFEVVQANLSVSKRGVLRGIHYSLAETGQSKWVTCATGSIWDVVVDLRPSSPTFKQSVGVELSGERGEGVIISAGLGHAFLALQDETVVSYLLTSGYSPTNEYGIDPFDTDLAINWPKLNHILSTQDREAPTLIDRLVQGLLPGHGL